MLKNNIQAVAYEKYKLTWMIKQGISLKDLIEALAEQQREDSSIGENKNLLAAYKDWELDMGFGSGSIWVCFDEFLDNEYQDTQFMRSILTEKEYRTYLDDIGDGWVSFVEAEQLLQEAVQKGILTISYTHLDVYKRQQEWCEKGIIKLGTVGEWLERRKEKKPWYLCGSELEPRKIVVRISENIYRKQKR